MKIINIPIADVQVLPSRVRPVSEKAAYALALDIEKRGLRQPIEVTKDQGGWVLVSGGHRLAACQQLGLDEIAAVEVSGSKKDIRLDELMENLARNELSALERCISTAELRDIYQQNNPLAKRGGDRKSADFEDQDQSATRGTLIEWYHSVATRSERAVRTIKRQAAIGARLSYATTMRLQGTEFEDNQRELEALSKLGAERQAEVIKLLFRVPDPATSVAGALAILGGHVAQDDPDAKMFNSVVDRFSRWSASQKKRFIDRVSDDLLADVLAERGYTITRAEAAE